MDILKCAIISFVILLLCSISSGELITNSHPIEAYSDKISVYPGETIKFSVHAPNSNIYRVKILRYGKDIGSGAYSDPETITGEFTCYNGTIRNYTNTSYMDGLTWPVSFEFVVPSGVNQKDGKFTCKETNSDVFTSLDSTIFPSNRRSGLYVAHLEDGTSSFDVTFIIKDPVGQEKRIALMASTNTWQAYNYWPDNGAMYDVPDGMIIRCNIADPAAKRTVSFIRPNPYSTPVVFDNNTGICRLPHYRTEHLAAGETRIARWLERNGYQYSMITDEDVHNGWNSATKKTALDPFYTVILNTHSEYWSSDMYKSLKSYLDKGGNVVSLSGNTIYWRVLIDADGSGNKTITKYDVPINGITPTWDTLTRDQMLLTGDDISDYIIKNNLVGFKYLGMPSPAECREYTNLANSQNSNVLAHWVFKSYENISNYIGTSGLIASPSSRCINATSGASGEEFDSHANTFAREYKVIGSGANQAYGTAEKSEIIYMRRASAGQVFSAGSITLGGSLAQGDNGLTIMLKNVLSRFDSRSFSDFTSDGFTDLIGKNPSDGHLWRFEGNGNSGFNNLLGTRFDAGWSIFDKIICPGDFDSDGHADILARKPDGSVFFYRGAGNGTLIQTAGLQVANNWNDYIDIITLGDFDGDGRIDLIGRKLDGTLWLHRGNGAGAFANSGILINGGWQIYSELMSPGDFDEDGIPDLIARKPDGTLWFYKGKGDGTLVQNPAKLIGVGWNEYSKLISAGDFDRDGHPDIFALKPDGTLLLYRGKGDGTFYMEPGINIGTGFNQYDSLCSVW